MTQRVSDASAADVLESARTVQAATRLQLQGALASIRAARAEDAVAFIERAIAIQERWHA